MRSRGVDHGDDLTTAPAIHAKIRDDDRIVGMEFTEAYQTQIREIRFAIGIACS